MSSPGILKKQFLYVLRHNFSHHESFGLMACGKEGTADAAVDGSEKGSGGQDLQQP